MRTGRTRVRFAAGISSVVVALATANAAYAGGLSQPTPISWDEPSPYGLVCFLPPPPPGEVLWHFELIRPEVPTPTLTVEFAEAGTINAGLGEIMSHPEFASWDITTGRDTLLSAFTDVDGRGGLNLTYICPGPLAPGETLPGSNVTVNPVSPGGGANPVQLTFQNVTAPGTTTLTVSGGESEPDVPAGFQLGDPPAFYDLSTTATFGGSITVCLTYAGITPGATALLHYEGGAWVDVTVSNDTVNQVICGVTTSLSPFAAVHEVPVSIVGFLAPLNDPISSANPMSVFKAGSTIPVKFALVNADGTPVSNAAASALAAACGARISLTRVEGGAPPVDEAVVSTTPHSGTCFRDAGAGQFLFNLGTRDLAKPATYSITATLTRANGTPLGTHSLLVGLR